MMFSGGLDSLAGVVQEAIVERHKVVLVHHRSTPKIARRHARLLNLFEEQAAGNPPFHIAVEINKEKGLSREPTQRTRSFLYVALGGAIAIMLGKSRLRFYENGVLSLNLPPSAQVVGARATRTTHPQVLNGFSGLLSALCDHRFSVENPFLWKTKTEIVRLIGETGCGPLIKHSNSCADTRKRTTLQTHCGVCSQCIDRRFAVLAAGHTGFDPEDAYGVDLLVGERAEGQPLTMLAAYVAMANRIEKMSAAEFFKAYGEAGRAIRHMGMPADAAAMRVYDLYQRHTKEVLGVIDRAVSEHSPSIRRGDLPPTCLIRLVSDSSAAATSDFSQPAQITPSPADPPANYFLKRGKAWEVRFAGREPFILLPSKGASYLHALLSHPGVEVSAAELVTRYGMPSRRRAIVAAGDASISPINVDQATVIDERTDREAINRYRDRVKELEREMERAKRNNDSGAQDAISLEREAIIEEIQGDKALGRRKRQFTSDQERARKSVSLAIDRVMKEIEPFDRKLFEHLSQSGLRLGKRLSYCPDGAIEWEM